MTITLELTPDEAERLRAQAAERRQAPEAIAHGFVHAGLDTPTPPHISEADHERLIQSLLEAGLITERPTRPLGPPPPPIRVVGPPVSQTLLEDRE